MGVYNDYDYYCSFSNMIVFAPLVFLVYLVTELTFTHTMNFAQVQVGKGRPPGWCPAQPGVETWSSF